MFKAVVASSKDCMSWSSMATLSSKTAALSRVGILRARDA